MEMSLELTEQERDHLTEEIASALEQMMDLTCAEMGPLWLEATRQQRVHLGTVNELPFRPSPKYLALNKSSRSKYRGLAAWRHAVMWQDVLVEVADGDYRAATEAMYFTPYPANEPPYAWSRSGERAPGVASFGTATTLKDYAKEGAWHTVAALRRRARELEANGSWHFEVRAGLVRVGCRDSLVDVLKLEALPPWEDG